MGPERKLMLDQIGFDFNHQDKVNEDNWNLQFEKLRDYYEKHGDCELFWAVDRFTFVLNIATNTPTLSLSALQVKCHIGTRTTQNWAIGSTISVDASKLAKWIRNEKGCSMK
jgi:hypothetical protein